VLPCEVRVTSKTHPLSGRLIVARSFKRVNGVLLAGDRAAGWLAGHDPGGRDGCAQLALHAESTPEIP
jgi:hypothetical protein